MDISKSVILTIAVLIALVINVMTIKLLLRKAKKITLENGNIKLSFGIWFSSLFLSCSLIIAKTISIFATAVDTIYKTNPENGILESFKTGSLLIGLSITWLLLWHYVVNMLTVLITGNRNEVKEVEIDNYPLFLVRGVLLIGFIICLLPAFEIILKGFTPSVDVPFYH